MSSRNENIPDGAYPCGVLPTAAWPSWNKGWVRRAERRLCGGCTDTVPDHHVCSRPRATSSSVDTAGWILRATSTVRFSECLQGLIKPLRSFDVPRESPIASTRCRRLQDARSSLAAESCYVMLTGCRPVPLCVHVDVGRRDWQVVLACRYRGHATHACHDGGVGKVIASQSE